MQTDTVDHPAGRKPRLTRKQLSEFLRAQGYPISKSVLDKLCMPSLNQGPPAAAWWGTRPLYDPDQAIAWAEQRLRPARASDQISETAA
jgi:hypothetical protein